MLLYYSLLSFLIASASAGSLTDLKHVVLFMQENRAFDHYFGTMPGEPIYINSIQGAAADLFPGVRGFADPNVQVNADGKSVFQQIVTANMSKKAEYLTPWYLNYLGGEWLKATQCMVSGSNSWVATHESYNGGLNNKWATW
jgi:phospholipase C